MQIWIRAPRASSRSSIRGRRRHHEKGHSEPVQASKIAPPQGIEVAAPKQGSAVVFHHTHAAKNLHQRIRRTGSPTQIHQGEARRRKRRTPIVGFGRKSTNCSSGQRKVFTTPFLAEINKHRNTNQFIKKKPPCQRGGVRDVANKNISSKRSNVANQATLQRLCVKNMLCVTNVGIELCG